MLFRLWNNICGYVIIKLEGVWLERLLNQFEKKGIPLWSIRRTSRARMTVCAPYLCLRRIQTLAEDMRCNVLAVQVKGFLPGLVRAAKRKLFAASALVAILAVVTFTRFLWVIEIDGRLEAQMDIAKRLAEMDIHIGMLWNDIDTQAVEKQLMQKNNEAAKILVNREGIKMVVEVIPIVKEPEYIADDRPCDIIAKQDGLVVSITALEGSPQVQRGDSVKAGDILIKGEYLLEENQKTKRVAARGNVLAKVWSTGIARVPIDEIQREETGKTFAIRTMYMGTWEIPVDRLPDDFGDYIIEDEVEQKISSLYIPASIKTTRVKGIVLKAKEREYSAAEDEGKKLAYQDALSRLPGEEGIQQVSYTSSILANGNLEVRAFLQTQEEIGEGRDQ